jgi:hypothetical protein
MTTNTGRVSPSNSSVIQADENAFAPIYTLPNELLEYITRIIHYLGEQEGNYRYIAQWASTCRLAHTLCLEVSEQWRTLYCLRRIKNIEVGSNAPFPILGNERLLAIGDDGTHYYSSYDDPRNLSLVNFSNSPSVIDLNLDELNHLKIGIIAACHPTDTGFYLIASYAILYYEYEDRKPVFKELLLALSLSGERISSSIFVKGNIFFIVGNKPYKFDIAKKEQSRVTGLTKTFGVMGDQLFSIESDRKVSFNVSHALTPTSPTSFQRGELLFNFPLITTQSYTGTPSRQDRWHIAVGSKWFIYRYLDSLYVFDVLKKDFCLAIECHFREQIFIKNDFLFLFAKIMGLRKIIHLPTRLDFSSILNLPFQWNHSVFWFSFKKDSEETMLELEGIDEKISFPVRLEEEGQDVPFFPKSRAVFKKEKEETQRAEQVELARAPVSTTPAPGPNDQPLVEPIPSKTNPSISISEGIPIRPHTFSRSSPCQRLDKKIILLAGLALLVASLIATAFLISYHPGMPLYQGHGISLTLPAVLTLAAGGGGSLILFAITAALKTKTRNENFN